MGFKLKKLVDFFEGWETSRLVSLREIVVYFFFLFISYSTSLSSQKEKSRVAASDSPTVTSGMYQKTKFVNREKPNANLSSQKFYVYSVDIFNQRYE